jgi:hypothetical protein
MHKPAVKPLIEILSIAVVVTYLLDCVDIVGVYRPSIFPEPKTWSYALHNSNRNPKKGGHDCKDIIKPEGSSHQTGSGSNANRNERSYG